ncbi:Sugar phosphate exchanger 3 [Chelonia mydas]|uniref:Sugar phosphate exchanger 3 n=1 Tax=Chelonia mydas TaxID=8469 RepID=M7AMQ7_CHEMY|nr:Sugar phosphate exchanger 3 [Chelonia mydas]
MGAAGAVPAERGSMQSHVPLPHGLQGGVGPFQEWRGAGREPALAPLHRQELTELWNSSHLFPNAEDATLFLGTLDTIFLFSYAVGLFVSGIVGDRLNLRWVLSFGMCSSALVFEHTIAMTVSSHKVHNCTAKLLENLAHKVLSLDLRFQTSQKAVSDHLRRGFVFGLWSACASVGNILGAFLASCVLQYGYEYAFLVTASVQFAGGIIVFFGLLISPKEVGLPELGDEQDGSAEEDANKPLMSNNEEDEDDQNYSIQAPDTINQPKPIGFFQACCLPGVLLHLIQSLGLSTLKTTVAQLQRFWVAITYAHRRIPPVDEGSPNSKPINAFIMAITGFFIGGPSNMISSAISADLGRQELVKGNSEALATVTGIVDGTGSIGAAVGQVRLPERECAFKILHGSDVEAGSRGKASNPN